MSWRLRRAVLALAVLAGVQAAAAGPLVVTGRAPGEREQPGRMLVLVLEAGPGGVTLRDARVVAGAPRVRRGSAPPAPGSLRWALRDAAGAALLEGAVDVPWTLHGDEPDGAGGLRSTSVRRESAAFPLKLPVVPGAAWLTFDPPPAAGGAQPPAALGRIALDGLLP